MIETNFIKLYESSFQDNWDLNAFTDLSESTTLTYGQFAKEVARLHILFEIMGVDKKDKIALIGRNHTVWASVFIAAISYGAVIVPVLHDFHPESMENIILHSDSKIIFIDPKIWQNLNKEKFTQPIFALPTFEMLKGETVASNGVLKEIEQQFNL